MDCTADMPANVVRDSSDKNSSSSDDFIPLSKLLMRQHSEDKQSCENTRSSIFSSNINTKKDKSVLTSDDSSDDEPLIRMKTASAKKSEKKDASTRSNGTNKKNADLKTDDSSDNEPLKKMVASKTAKKPSSVPPKKSVETKKKEAPDDDASSDDEPLTEVAKKIKYQRQAKSPRKANLVTKSKRNADRKKVKYAESSSGSSDYEPLATKRKKKITAKEQKSSANTRNTKSKLTGKSLKDNSSDDDVPLVNLIDKPRNTKTTKRAAVSQGRVSKKREGIVYCIIWFHVHKYFCTVMNQSKDKNHHHQVLFIKRLTLTLKHFYFSPEGIISKSLLLCLFLCRAVR
ncbi:uncharacterized protein LOC128374082 isoform X2 [Scomber japonicus]|uniref:uncharacterized protein LOC128374082 isoform X2 n=1 Tax=Scomber japonicus TaxID=13676 RepID=UPI00230644E4|nr:uncharacterized protein LOC128374082 isoform X2 [Scomber japonicus]